MEGECFADELVYSESVLTFRFDFHMTTRITGQANGFHFTMAAGALPALLFLMSDSKKNSPAR